MLYQYPAIFDAESPQAAEPVFQHVVITYVCATCVVEGAWCLGPAKSKTKQPLLAIPHQSKEQSSRFRGRCAASLRRSCLPTHLPPAAASVLPASQPEERGTNP